MVAQRNGASANLSLWNLQCVCLEGLGKQCTDHLIGRQDPWLIHKFRKGYFATPRPRTEHAHHHAVRVAEENLDSQVVCGKGTWYPCRYEIDIALPQLLKFK